MLYQGEVYRYHLRGEREIVRETYIREIMSESAAESVQSFERMHLLKTWRRTEAATSAEAEAEDDYPEEIVIDRRLHM